MTRKERFVVLVQTAAVIESLSRDKWLHKHLNPRSMAVVAVNAAMQVSEEKLPSNLTEACDDLIAYVYENTIPKPDWLIGIL